MNKITSLLMLLLAIFLLPVKAVADDDEEEEPYVEPAFTVYLDIDNADAVYVTVNGKRVPHTAGVNTVTVDPGDGYIMVYVNDGFAFTKFLDVEENGDYLQYDVQTMPVTIRKVLGVGSEEGIIVDGHTFTIETVDTSLFDRYTLTVNVDDASMVEMRVGNSIDISASSNRTVTLVNGDNTVTYLSTDRYLHLRSNDFNEPLYSVTCNGNKVVDDGQINKVYTVLLNGESSAGSEIVVTAKAPVVEDAYHFTVSIDDAENVYGIKRMPQGKFLPFEQGDNTYGFNDGDSYEIWCSEQPAEVSLNGAELSYEKEFGTFIYRFTPTDGGKVVVGESGEMNGIGTVGADANASRAIYNLQGVRIAGDADADTLRALPAGVYIIGGRKVVVK